MRSSVICGLKIGKRDADMPTTSIQKDTAFNSEKEAKDGTEANSYRSSFKDSSFTKTLRNLQSLEMPAPFVKLHGGNFQLRVVFQGPCGRLIAVRLTIESTSVQDRVHIRGPEWRHFLLENVFKVGDELVFSLVSKSTFTVRLSGAAKYANIDHQETGKSRMCSGARRAKSAPKSIVRRVDEVSRFPVTTAVADEPVWALRVRSDVVYGRGISWSSRRRVDMLVGELRCPHFVLTINKSHLREVKSCSLRVPREFYYKYATYFSDEGNIFQGPSGRMMKVRFARNGVRFTSGWKAFHRENYFQLGDVILFSLCEPARWLVQFVEGKMEEDRPAESECGRSDL